METEAIFEYVGMVFICQLRNGSLVGFRSATNADQLNRIPRIANNYLRLLTEASETIIDKGKDLDCCSLLVFFIQFANFQTEGRTEKRFKTIMSKIPSEDCVEKSRIYNFRDKKEGVKYCEIDHEEGPSDPSKVKKQIKTEQIVQIKEEVGDDEQEHHQDVEEEVNNNREEQALEAINEIQLENGDLDDGEEVEQVEARQVVEEEVENNIENVRVDLAHLMVENNEEMNVEPQESDNLRHTEGRSTLSGTKRPSSDDSASSSSSGKIIKLNHQNISMSDTHSEPSSSQAIPAASVQVPMNVLPSNPMNVMQQAQNPNSGNNTLPIASSPPNLQMHLAHILAMQQYAQQQAYQTLFLQTCLQQLQQVQTMDQAIFICETYRQSMERMGYHQNILSIGQILAIYAHQRGLQPPQIPNPAQVNLQLAAQNALQNLAPQAQNQNEQVQEPAIHREMENPNNNVPPQDPNHGGMFDQGAHWNPANHHPRNPPHQ